MQIYKPSWHKIVSDNLLAIISKCFAIFSNVQIEVIYQLRCVCCPICKPLTVKHFSIHNTLSSPIYDLTYDEVGSWNIRLICGTRYSGGSLPYSPTEIILLVVALTRSIHRAYCKKTLSVSPQSLDFIPQTSLPYIKIGFINVSKRLSIRSGGSSPIAFILVFILNMAFLAWSHKNWYVFFSASWLGDFIELMMLPRYL